MKASRSMLALSLLLAALLSACSGMGGAPAASKDEDAMPRPAGWSDESHGPAAEPNYEVVFPQDRVNRLTISIAPEQWQAMQANMTALFGEKGSSPSGGSVRQFRRTTGEEVPPEGETGVAPADRQPAADEEVIIGGAAVGGHQQVEAVALPKEQPMWVPATVEFDGRTWTNVGVRYKGNSSLVGSWHSDSQKLPLKLDFDEFEKEFPEITDQRFFGFKQLSLANHSGDNSAMRDAIVADLLRAAGLPAAETAYYEVYLDYGEGPVRLGLYSMIEVIDDTVVERAFGDGSGTVYEADGPAVTLARGAAGQFRSSFQVERNRAQADWSDIQALYDALHSERRISDPAGWRADLEAVFDVDAFLKWLALSAIIEHWDTYGAMTHNFYLYHNPETGKLTWISWDHNFTLGALGMVVKRWELDEPPADGAPPVEAEAGQPDTFVVEGAPPEGFVVQGGPEGSPAQSGQVVRLGGPGTSLDKADVGEDWPLIRYLLDDPSYHERYIGFLRQLTDSVFDPAALEEHYQRNAALIRSYIAQEGSAEEFDAAVRELIDYTKTRAQTVDAFLADR